MPSNPLTDPEWAERSVDFIDRIIAIVRRYTTRPLLKTARGVVFGLLGAIGLVSALVIFCIVLTRGLQSALDSGLNHTASVWVSYFIASGVFLLLGIVLLRRRHTKEDT